MKMRLRLLFCLAGLVCELSTSHVSGADAPLPRSCSPPIERAAEALAESRFPVARDEFKRLADDQSHPALVRGLALLGAAEADLGLDAGGDAAGLWRRLSSDVSLPQWQRELAARRIAETERRKSATAGRDPTAYREPLPRLPVAAARFYVGPEGSDAASGSETSPFRTLERARDAVRALKKSGGGALPSGGTQIVILGGEFPVKQTFTLTAEDSGTAEAPVVYQAKPGQTPVFTGGIGVRGWQSISDPAMRDKLDPAVREKVLVADLKAAGVVDWGDATQLRHQPELFAAGVPQTLARWPNDGFVKTGEVLGTNRITDGGVSGCTDGLFRFQEDRPLLWLDEPDVRLYGYWFWDWFEEFQKVASIDPQKHAFVLAQPYSNYGYRRDQRYYALNVFHELDQPGEWYLDRRQCKIYWLPPAQNGAAQNQTVLSVCQEPFLVLKNVSHVILLGLTFQAGRGDGIHIEGGDDCLVAGCTLRRLGGDAVVVQGGLHHGIFGCAMHTLGCGGVRVVGGDRQTLSPGRHFVENCTVSNISRLKRTYTPAVLLEGCGNRVAHNLFEHMPSSALRVEGNDHLVELNCIRHVVQESDDQGGVDMYGNPLYRGVIIRWNRWSDVQGGTRCGAAGVRLDDMISGVTVQGNLFERCGSVLFGAIQVHGGKDNALDGNVFIDCPAAMSFTPWDNGRWRRGIEPFLKQAREPLYSTRYPALARLDEDANANFVTRNLFVNCPKIFLRAGGHERCALNQASQAPLSVESLADSELKDPRLRRILLEPIPVDEIGPYPHPWNARF